MQPPPDSTSEQPAGPQPVATSPEVATGPDPVALPGENDLRHMDAALELARQAGALGEVPVGAVVIDKDGRMLGAAFNQSVALKDATAHAEVLALRQAQQAHGDFRLTDCTLYVTKEPCPMCAGAAILTRVSRVVFGLSDPKAGAMGGAFNVMALPGVNHRCDIVRGVRESETHAVLRQFFTQRRKESAARREAAQEPDATPSDEAL